MSSNAQKIPFIFFVTLALFFASLSAAHALNVSPLRVEEYVHPGQVYKGTIVVTNPTGQPVQVQVSVGEYRFIGSARSIPPQDSSLKKIPSCKRWITFEEAEHIIGPNEANVIPYIISIPNAAKRESVASIILDRVAHTDASASLQSQGTIQVVSRLSIPVYISIEGHAYTSARALIETVAYGREDGLLEVKGLLKNTGLRHIRAVGTVAIFSNNTGQLISEVPMGKTLPIFSGFQEQVITTLRMPSEGSYLSTLTIEIADGEVIQAQLPFSVDSYGELKL
jgi:P pilus assembly chaperone PapD